jgi:hypothetical protein
LYAFDTVVRDTPSSAASEARVAGRRALGCPAINEP